MVTQTRDVSRSFRIVFQKPDKMSTCLVVIPATKRVCFCWRPPYMYLFCLGESGQLAEREDSAKIVVAIPASGYLYE